MCVCHSYSELDCSLLHFIHSLTVHCHVNKPRKWNFASYLPALTIRKWYWVSTEAHMSANWGGFCVYNANQIVQVRKRGPECFITDLPCVLVQSLHLLGFLFLCVEKTTCHIVLSRVRVCPHPSPVCKCLLKCGKPSTASEWLRCSAPTSVSNWLWVSYAPALSCILLHISPLSLLILSNRYV